MLRFHALKKKTRRDAFAWLSRQAQMAIQAFMILPKVRTRERCEVQNDLGETNLATR